MIRLLTHFTPKVLALPRGMKRAIVLFVDIIICIFTVWLAYYLRLGDFSFIEAGFYLTTYISLIFALPIFILCGLYRTIFRYSGLAAIKKVAQAVSIYTLFFSSIISVIGISNIPRTIGFIQPLLFFFCVAASRMFAHYWFGSIYKKRLKLANLPKTLIYGAGAAGRQLAAAMENSYEMRVIGFLDDDDRLTGQVLNGLPIYDPKNISELINSKGITHVLLALPSVSRMRRNQIIEKMLEYRVAVRTLPSLSDMAKGKITFSDLRELDIDDLLGRDPVEPNHLLLSKNITGKVVLITGAGGSIGSELSRQILKLNPELLLILDVSEFALYSIHMELESLLNGGEITFDFNSDERHTPLIIPLLASVLDEARMKEIISTWNPHTVFHAAAYKHVPIVEHNLTEGIKNNVLGTYITAKIAIDNGVSNFVLVSTDKAVRPTNIMGASKRLAEIILQSLYAEIQYDNSTKLSMVRFGNVLDSSGSVIPKFRKQIKNGGPITLTHPEINRFFMTIPEAAQLVLQACSLANGGDVFVLDMGKPVKIYDLATRMIELSGLSVYSKANPDGDIEIKITGLRPGEKLYEELLIGEHPQPTTHAKIMRANDKFIPWRELFLELEELKSLLYSCKLVDLRDKMKKLVIEYQPNSEIVDWTYSRQSQKKININ